MGDFDGIKRGYWEWNDLEKTIEFVCVNCLPEQDASQIDIKKKHRTAASEAANFSISFRDTMSVYAQANFQKRIRRKSSDNVTSFITLADIKDVVLFTIIEPLPQSFLIFFDTPMVDTWLRATIVYMQYFIKMCEETAKLEAFLPTPASKTHPSWTTEMSQNLNDLRAIVGRQHFNMLLSVLREKNGHFKGSSTQEIQNFELLLRIGIRVIWVALIRCNHLHAIETEMFRLFRTKTYTKSIYQKENSEMMKSAGKHKQIVQQKEKIGNMFQNTPVYNEFSDNTKDYRLLQIGRNDFNTSNKRLGFLTSCFYSSESQLAEEGITVGILGQKRSRFDFMLFPIVVTQEMLAKAKRMMKQATNSSSRQNSPSHSKDNKLLENNSICDLINMKEMKLQRIPRHDEQESIYRHTSSRSIK